METLQELLYKYPAYKEAEGLFGKKGKACNIRAWRLSKAVHLQHGYEGYRAAAYYCIGA